MSNNNNQAVFNLIFYYLLSVNLQFLILIFGGHPKDDGLPLGKSSLPVKDATMVPDPFSPVLMLPSRWICNGIAIVIFSDQVLSFCCWFELMNSLIDPIIIDTVKLSCKLKIKGAVPSASCRCGIISAVWLANFMSTTIRENICGNHFRTIIRCFYGDIHETDNQQSCKYC